MKRTGTKKKITAICLLIVVMTSMACGAEKETAAKDTGAPGQEAIGREDVPDQNIGPESDAKQRATP